jgi:hypothetical protein
MAGLMWRYDAQHGDYNDIHVRIDIEDHPIMKGLEDFDTREELTAISRTCGELISRCLRLHFQTITSCPGMDSTVPAGTNL